MAASRSRIEVGSDGFPVLRAPERLADQARAAAPKPVQSQPTGLSSEVDRRRDAVREAAREFEPLSDQDVRERLRGVTNRPLTEAEVASFAADVAAQVVDDLVDGLDQMLRGRKRRRRTVRVVMPRGYVRKALNDRTDAELQSVADRLVARGWTADQVKDHYARHLQADRVLRVTSSRTDDPATASP
jgi:hypothetical protein